MKLFPSLFILVILIMTCEDSSEITLVHITPQHSSGVLTYENVYIGKNSEADKDGFIVINYEGGKGTVSFNEDILVTEEQIAIRTPDGKLERNLKFVEGGICTSGRKTSFLVVEDSITNTLENAFLSLFMHSPCGSKINTKALANLRDSSTLSRIYIDRNPNGHLPLGPYKEYHLEDGKRIWSFQNNL